MSRRVKLKSRDVAAVQEFIERIRDALRNNLVEVKLFGSKATGKDQPDSDRDVLVAVEKCSVEVEDEVLDIAFDTNLKHDVYISPRVIDRPHAGDPYGGLPLFLKLSPKRAFAVKPEREIL